MLIRKDEVEVPTLPLLIPMTVPMCCPVLPQWDSHQVRAPGSQEDKGHPLVRRLQTPGAGFPLMARREEISAVDPRRLRCWKNRGQSQVS